MAFNAIQISYGELETSIEGEVMKAVQKVGIDVDKGKLLEALQLAEQLVHCKDCKWWDRTVIGHTQGCEDIGDRLCRRHLWWTMETDYCSSGADKRTEQTETSTEEFIQGMKNLKMEVKQTEK